MKKNKIKLGALLTTVTAFLLTSCGNSIVDTNKLVRVESAEAKAAIQQGIVEAEVGKPNLEIKGSFRLKTSLTIDFGEISSELENFVITTEADASIDGLFAEENMSFELDYLMKVSADGEQVANQSKNKINVQDDKLYLHQTATFASDGASSSETISLAYLLPASYTTLIEFEFDDLFELDEEDSDALVFYEMGDKYVIGLEYDYLLQEMFEDDLMTEELPEDAIFDFFIVFDNEYKFESLELKIDYDVVEVGGEADVYMDLTAKKTNRTYKPLTAAEIAEYNVLEEEIDIGDITGE